jgi:hypothetical protein
VPLGAVLLFPVVTIILLIVLRGSGPHGSILLPSSSPQPIK